MPVADPGVVAVAIAAAEIGDFVVAVAIVLVPARSAVDVETGNPSRGLKAAVLVGIGAGDVGPNGTNTAPGKLDNAADA